MNWCTKFHFLPTLPRLFTPTTNGTTALVIPVDFPADKYHLGARIVSVANTLDSITSELCYRPARTFQAAPEEICMGAGRQFDPEIVKVFLSLPDNVWSDLTKEIQSEASMRMQSHYQRCSRVLAY
jgi:HD-GYP domain-containing protein (c-di-GMP phosphodiesterase class II)